MLAQMELEAKGTSRMTNLLIGHKAISHDRTMVLSWANNGTSEFQQEDKAVSLRVDLFRLFAAWQGCMRRYYGSDIKSLASKLRECKC